MRKFKDDLRDNGRSPTRVRVVMASFGALLADALERGLVATNVVRSSLSWFLRMSNASRARY
jgi:hypothetical protein